MPQIKKKKVILGVGRFGDHLKGFDRLIEAFAKLKNKSWELHFAGGDEDGEYLKKIARDLGIIERINFLGKVTNINKVYAYSAIFVIPSRSEGFPNALCEAMAAGLPCISFDFISGPRDLIKDGDNGFIIEEGNIEALAEKIDYLIEHDDVRERIGAEAKKIAEKLDEELVARMFVDFMERTVGIYRNK